MYRKLIVSTFFVVTMAASAADFSSECQHQWHQWRGPLANGTAPNGDPPVQWSETNHVKWKAPILGEGSATPIVWGDQVFVVAAVRTERTVDVLPTLDQEPPGGYKTERPRKYYRFEVLSLDRRTGRTRWQRTAIEAVPHEGRHETNSYASASPSTDGQRLYVSFGSHGIYCYDLQGNFQWKRDLGQMVTRFGWGEGSSPALYGDALVVNWDHEGQSFLTVLDAKTGETRWKADRDEVSSWATPLVTQYGGGVQVVVNATRRTTAYDLATGRILWQCAGQTTNVIPSPVRFGDMAIAMSGFQGTTAFAIPLESVGDNDKVIPRLVELAGESETLAGWVLSDEPSREMLPRMEELRKRFRKADPQRFCLVVSMWPQTPYVPDETRLPVVCVDLYPFFGPRDPNGPHTDGASRHFFRIVKNLPAPMKGHPA